MNLKSIEYFLVTAEEMNFTRAAERLYISQQALSGHIKRLESEYNIQLFERKPTLRLTQGGEQFVHYGNRILTSEKCLRSKLSDISADCYAHLTIGISRLRGKIFIPMILSQYHQTYPNVSIKLVDGNSDKFQELLQSGKIDLYVGIDIPATHNQQFIELAREQMQCCMSQDFLQRSFPNNWRKMMQKFEQGADLKDIAYLPLITLCSSNRLRKRLNSLFSGYSINPHFAFEAESQDLLYQLTKLGYGVGIFSPVALYQNTREIDSLGDSFHIFPIRDDMDENVLSLVYRTDYTLPEYTKDFIDIAYKVFQLYRTHINRHSNDLLYQQVSTMQF
ncbi:LysR family transcriptional regulator [Fusibacter paucivorans]|uniref:LysR family transcriptional regulator n=1 Tax=Fusibacter paucivorans TaxID=76009 RepID=A0ABS5PQZ9_9FIRM|nr:LysR family transcriptional regulator [Fusibacter paucivorans]MBS7527593.1 LysR family transcriptional regulator [Fusibacter paucivorans]